MKRLVFQPGVHLLCGALCTGSLPQPGVRGAQWLEAGASVGPRTQFGGRRGGPDGGALRSNRALSLCMCLCRSEDSFKQYFSEMPWLAVPYTDEARRSRLNRLYGIQGRRSRLRGSLESGSSGFTTSLAFLLEGKEHLYFHECSHSSAS